MLPDARVRVFNGLILHLKLLAADSDAQRQWHSEFWAGFAFMEDMVDEFGDYFWPLAHQFRDAGMMSNQAYDKLQDIFTYLVGMDQEDDSLWSLAALESRAEWEQLRRLAQEALVLLGKAGEHLDLNKRPRRTEDGKSVAGPSSPSRVA
jgi:hypothetical protein